MNFLKQSTAVTIKFGPVVDASAATPETSWTIQKADVRLSKNGGDFAAASADQGGSDAGAPHDELGMYDVSLDTTDTNTLGRLTVAHYESGTLVTVQEYMVLPANVFDSLVAGSDNLQVDAVQLLGTAFATPTVAGVPEVDVTHVNGSAASTTAGGVTVSAASIQEIAKLGRNYESVYYLRKDGNDSNDGLTPSTAKLTFASALSLLDDGDALDIGPGNFEVASGGVTIPAGVHMWGCGLGMTVLQGDAGGGSVDVLINPASRTRFSRLSIVNDIAATSFGVAVGHVGGVHTAGTDIHFEDCDLIGVSDAVYIEDGSNATGYTFTRCRFVSDWDGVAVFANTSASYVRMIDCRWDITGPSSIGAYNGRACGVIGSQCYGITIVGGSMNVTGGTSSNVGVFGSDDNNAASRFELIGLAVWVTGTGSASIASDSVEAHTFIVSDCTLAVPSSVGTNTSVTYRNKLANVYQWRGSSVPSSANSSDVPGTPSVRVQSGTGTGQINLSSGNVTLTAASIASIWTTALTESYAADGATFTGAQALYGIWAGLFEFSISGTTKTNKQLDGSATAFVQTLDDATNPTSTARTT